MAPSAQHAERLLLGVTTLNDITYAILDGRLSLLECHEDFSFLDLCLRHRGKLEDVLRGEAPRCVIDGRQVTLTAIPLEEADPAAGVMVFAQCIILPPDLELVRGITDSMNQLLFSARTMVEVLPVVLERDPDMALSSLVDLSLITRGAVAELNQLMYSLAPQTTGHTAIAEHIDQLAEGLRLRGCRVDISSEGGGTLPNDVHRAIYKVVWHTFAAVRSQQTATRVTVSYEEETGRARLCVMLSDSVLKSTTYQTLTQEAHAINAGVQMSLLPDGGSAIDLVWEAP